MRYVASPLNSSHLFMRKWEMKRVKTVAFIERFIYLQFKK
ncbi:hypothetical protein ADU37_CDS15490 [Thermococcus sp. 2319x1]|nr:hypothetical protein ADU37_CDS15490 [Thermococcus sp. 2319x1]